MLRDLGLPIMSHDNKEVDEWEILDGFDRPKKPGEIEIDLTSVGEAITASVTSVNKGGLRIVDNVRSLLRGIGPRNTGNIEGSRLSYKFHNMLRSLRARAS